MTHVLAIINQKGGVAKTTSCVSLGACLAEQGRRTLIVDLDPQANLTMALGLDPENLKWSIADLLDHSQPQPDQNDVLQPTVVSGLDILPADARLTDLERNLHEQLDYEKTLAQVLSVWQRSDNDNGRYYDYILLDCPPSMSALTLLALTAAENVLIPLQCDYFATRGLTNLLEVVEAVQERTNPLLRYYLFVTLFNSRPTISQQILEQLRSHFPRELLNTIIGMDTRLRESIMTGEPVTIFAPKTRASQQYRSLAAELMTLLEKKEASQ